MNGELIDTIELGPRPVGLSVSPGAMFPTYIDENAAVRLDAFADTGSGREAVSSSVFAEVLAASTGARAVFALMCAITAKLMPPKS